MKVLISGGGIAGPTLAYWLQRYGFETTLVEKSTTLRTGGYVIDFWGAGFDIAERMDLLPELKNKGYMITEVRVVDRNGKRVTGFPATAFSRIAKSRYVSLPRGDLAASIFRRIEKRVEVIFGDSISEIYQTKTNVRVVFESGNARDFDLVIGADGLHSRVRQIVFGTETTFEKYLGYKVAAFQVAHYQPRDELVYVMYTKVGQQVGRFAMRDDQTMFLFTFADEQASGPEDVQAQKRLLRERFQASGWECPRILHELNCATNFYFDRVSQIRMDPQNGLWTRGRVTLVGDAAFCVSFLAGQGAALAMTAAYILAGELNRARGDYAVAFAEYQRLFGTFVREKQRAALRFAGSFAPKSKLSLLVRNQIFRLMAIPWVVDAMAGRGMKDHIELSQY